MCARKKIIQRLIFSLILGWALHFNSMYASLSGSQVQEGTLLLARNTWGPHPKQSSRSVSPQEKHSLKLLQQKIIEAADQVIGKKVNYCHHHDFTWPTPKALREENSDGGYCSTRKALYSRKYPENQGKLIRWNYSGKGNETAEVWQNNGMWFGIDCSNFTSWIYQSALGIYFSSSIHKQSGQKVSKKYNTLSPQYLNTKEYRELDSKKRKEEAYLKYSDLGVSSYPGEYISVFSNDTTTLSREKFLAQVNKRISNEVLENLNPGDLIYIAGGNGKNGKLSTKVTHVVIWTGKRVGEGKGDIPADRIAPNAQCPNDWQPKTGDWVIIDSHYQGPDYRTLTNCFYKNNIWGIKRIDLRSSSY